MPERIRYWREQFREQSARIQNLCGTLTIVSIGMAVGMLSMTPAPFFLARIFVGIAIILLCITVFAWSLSNSDPNWLKITIWSISVIMVFGGAPTLFTMIYQREVLSTPPHVAIRLVFPDEPAFQLINDSPVVADHISYSIAIWNITKNNPAPLPIISQEFGYLQPGQKSLPKKLFESAKEQLSAGDELVGSFHVSCPTCRGVTYIVYVIWGTGGWYGESAMHNDGMIIPETFSMTGVVLSDLANKLTEYCPESSRHNITAY